MTRKELIASLKSSPSVSFYNEHGEKFTITRSAGLIFMSGDEVRTMVNPRNTVGGFIPLFNKDFGIWGLDELVSLGEALIKLNSVEIEAPRGVLENLEQGFKAAEVG